MLKINGQVLEIFFGIKWSANVVLLDPGLLWNVQIDPTQHQNPTNSDNNKKNLIIQVISEMDG